MTFWEWIGTTVLGLQGAVLIWLVKDYLQFRLTIIPTLITERQCLRFQAENRQVLKEIREHLERGESQFKKIAVTLARLCTRLEVDFPG